MAFTVFRPGGDIFRYSDNEGRCGIEKLMQVGENKGSCLRYVQDGELHREDGPAVEYLDPPLEKYWWYHGENAHWIIDGKIIFCSSQQDFERWKKIKVIQMKCPICDRSMYSSTIYDPYQPPIPVWLCADCPLEKWVVNANGDPHCYYLFNNVEYSDDEFDRIMQLKGFW